MAPPLPAWLSVIRHNTSLTYLHYAVGLERILRLVQAIIQILLAYPVLVAYAVLLHPFQQTTPPNTSAANVTPPPAAAALPVLSILTALRPRIALARRVFRLFRFLENFHAAHQLALTLSSSSSPPSAAARAADPPRPRAETWLALLARSCNGAYLLLESATLADALAVPGLRVFGPGRAGALALEAQRFWFLSLAFAVAAGAAALVRAAAASAPPVPDSGDGDGLGAEGAAGEKAALEGDERAPRLRAGGLARKDRRLAGRGRAKARSRAVLRRLVADAMDLAVPGSAIGWVRLEPGVVSVLMLGSTVLTGLEVWERCGEEVRRTS